MPIRFRCQDCESRMKVPDGSQGRRVKCPKCGVVQKVPAESAPVGRAEAEERTPAWTSQPPGAPQPEPQPDLPNQGEVEPPQRMVETLGESMADTALGGISVNEPQDPTPAVAAVQPSPAPEPENPPLRLAPMPEECGEGLGEGSPEAAQDLESPQSPGDAPVAATPPSEESRPAEASRDEAEESPVFHVDHESTAFRREIEDAAAERPAGEEAPTQLTSPTFKPPGIRVVRPPEPIPLGRPQREEDVDEEPVDEAGTEPVKMRLAPRHPAVPTFEDRVRSTPASPSPLTGVAWLLRGLAILCVLATIALATRMLTDGVSALIVLPTVVFGLTLGGAAWGIAEIAMVVAQSRH